MKESSAFQQELAGLDADDSEYVPKLVEAILSAARLALASDVHLRPTADAFEMKWRIDGVLQDVARFPKDLAPKVIARLKVLADLLTYRTETPQEGRVRTGDSDLETRISTFPTLFGEKAVIRLFVGSGKYRHLDELGLPEESLEELRPLLNQTGGVILLTGPAGSGKTTTIYACLREIVNKSGGGRCLVSLEDPVEVVVPGVDQSQVNPAANFDMATGLKSLLRQDPEVIMVGEIRDRATAETVFQASLTGHLVISTFHAGSAAQAITRLRDMGIERYLLRSGLLVILCQRLLRKLCHCARRSENLEDRLGLEVDEVRLPLGCDACADTGYHGRIVVTEMLSPALEGVGQAIMSDGEAGHLEEAALSAGMISQWKRACGMVQMGVTSPAEVHRVFGLSRQT